MLHSPNAMKHIVTFSLALASLSTSAQSAVQYRLDTISNAGGILRQGVVTPDGDHWAILNTANGKVLWKADPNGTPLWSMMLDSIYANGTLTALPNNDCALVGSLPSQHTAGALYDTLFIHITVTVLNPGGSTAWSRTVSTNVLYSGIDFGQASLGIVSCEPGPNNDLFVLSNVELGSSDFGLVTPFLFKFNGSGDLLWSKSYGRIIDVFVVWDYGVEQIRHSSDGGGYLFAEGAGNSIDVGPRLLRFGPNGGKQWFERAVYTNSSSWAFGNVMVDANDHPVLAGSLDLGNPYYGFVLNLDQLGQLGWARLYEGAIGYSGYGGASRIGGNDLFRVSARSFVRTDISGSVLDAMASNDTSIAPHDFSFSPTSFGVANERVVLPGNITSVHQIFGYQESWPSFWSFAMDQPDGCLMHSIPVTPIDVPDTLIELNADTSYHSFDAVVQVAPATFSATPRPPIQTLQACSIFVGIEEQSDKDSGLRIIENPVAADGTLRLEGDFDADLKLFTANGDLVRQDSRHRRDRQTAISLAGLPPGAYELNAIGMNGSLHVSLPVLITP